MLIILLAVSLIPLIAISVVAYMIAEGTVTKQAPRQLKSVVEIQRHRVEGRLYTILSRCGG